MFASSLIGRRTPNAFAICNLHDVSCKRLARLNLNLYHRWAGGRQRGQKRGNMRKALLDSLFRFEARGSDASARAQPLIRIENVLISEYEIERGPLDMLWSCVGYREQESKEGKRST
ncbi:hypothetical protein GGP91_003168 [Salinibacter ruber]|nr:hypothetical protein [Salinibacter ruber]MCS3831069.1 hypothetical protein [Salinibacter ruber]MCS4048985.1 hypothetical protein [Salinibacter ruber]MCS4057638.1 hypothetical protein [Salinibacter ruber]MCS4060896.1 hypothetical protein [Salinibacter ruber]